MDIPSGDPPRPPRRAALCRIAFCLVLAVLGASSLTPPQARADEPGGAPDDTWERPPRLRSSPQWPSDDVPFRAVSERQFGLGTAAMVLDFVHAREPARLSGLSDYAIAGLSFRAIYG